MTCSLCHKNPATLTLKHVVEGVTRDLRVCADCAGKQGFENQLPIPSLTDFLFGVGAYGMECDADVTCSGCHMHQTDFHKTQLLGCPACYQAFIAEIEGLLASMHKGSRHLGKVPRRRTAMYLRALERAVDERREMGDTAAAERLKQYLRELVRRSAARALRGKAPKPTESELPMD